MRASPPCQVSLRRFGAWRLAVLTLALGGGVVIVSWLAGKDPPASSGLLMLSALAALPLLACAASLWRVPAQNLRWDGASWRLDAVSGGLRVAVDLGPWMLLCFTPEDRGRCSWLPIQRRGLEAHWHALRCAVYSPRPPAEP